MPPNRVIAWSGQVKDRDYNVFVVALKNGDIIDSESTQTDPEHEKKNREGLSSLAEWNEAMNSFGDAFRTERLPEDRFADCCPNCGSRLVKGLCLRCGIRPYEN